MPRIPNCSRYIVGYAETRTNHIRVTVYVIHPINEDGSMGLVEDAKHNS